MTPAPGITQIKHKRTWRALALLASWRLKMAPIVHGGITMAVESIEAHARQEVRRAVREKLFEELTTGDDLAGQLQRVELAVMDALDEPRVAWALACLAGVRTAPAWLLKQLTDQQRAAHEAMARAGTPTTGGAQAQPAQPPAAEGG